MRAVFPAPYPVPANGDADKAARDGLCGTLRRREAESAGAHRATSIEAVVPYVCLVHGGAMVQQGLDDPQMALLACLHQGCVATQLLQCGPHRQHNARRETKLLVAKA
jgi:hypothetical protein